MNEPQVWTLIGVFAASLFAMMTMMSTTFVRAVDAKFERVDAKFDALDRDIQALMRHTFPDRP